MSIHEGSLVLTPEDCALIVRALNKDNPMDVLTGGEYDRYNELLYSLRESARLVSARLVPAPLNGDKVWGGSPMYRRSELDNGKTHNQIRTIVRAKNKAEAMRLLAGIGQALSPTHFNNYWGITGNRLELSLVTERGVWAESKKGWVKLWPK